MIRISILFFMLYMSSFTSPKSFYEDQLIHCLKIYLTYLENKFPNLRNKDKNQEDLKRLSEMENLEDTHELNLRQNEYLQNLNNDLYEISDTCNLLFKWPQRFCVENNRSEPEGMENPPQYFGPTNIGNDQVNTHFNDLLPKH